MPYNQRSFALKHHRGTHGRCCAMRAAMDKNLPGMVVRRVVLLSFLLSYVENQRFYPAWPKSSSKHFATMNAPQRVQILLGLYTRNWTLDPPSLWPTVSGYYRQRRGGPLSIESEREKGATGGCNYIAGG